MPIQIMGGQGCGVRQLGGFSPLYPDDITRLKDLIKGGKRNGQMMICTITDPQIERGGPLMKEVLGVLRDEGFIQAARWKNGVHAPWNMCTSFMWWNADIAEVDKKEYLPVSAAQPAIKDDTRQAVTDTIASIRKQLTALNRKL